MFVEWSWIVGLFLGATIGSFLNVVIYRTPRGLSLSDPKNSFCPKCKHRLGVPDLFPLLSWLVLRGRCRHCRAPVSSRYFFVELITGGIFAGLWWQYLIVSWEPLRAVAYALAAAGLVAIIFIDWEMYIIPDEINAWLLVVGLLYHSLNGSILSALWGALLGWGLLWGIAVLGRLLFRKDAMGHGDIKMMRGMGAVLGPLLLGASVLMAVFLGAIIGVLLIGVATLQRRAAGEEAEDLGEPTAESLKSLMLCGIWYLACLDVVALAFPKLNAWLERELPDIADEEEDDWKPSLTTIPFGPYLAAGAIVCMIFAPSLERDIAAYWEQATVVDSGAPAP
jgi:leader peptidase (prepilin peptidase) / N-methyltransferase